MRRLTLHLLLLLAAARSKGASSSESPAPNVSTATMGENTATVTPELNTTGHHGNSNDSSVGQETDVWSMLLSHVKEVRVLVAFGLGVVLTVVVWALIKLCCRCRGSLHVSETLELVSTETVKETGQKDQASQTPAGAEEEQGAKEVEYSDIDFSALRKKDLPQEALTQEATETEYAEITPGRIQEEAQEEEAQGEEAQEEEAQGEEAQEEEAQGEEAQGEEKMEDAECLAEDCGEI
ncbi:unnamed protein product [Knipowitschia caucasica]